MKNFIFLFSLTLLLLANLGVKAQNSKLDVNSPTPVMSKADDSTALASRLVELLAKEDFTLAAQNFDPAVKAALPPEKLQAVWQSLVGQLGAFKRQVGVQTQSLPEYEVVLVTCEFERGTIDVKIAFNNTQQVSGLFFVPTQTAAASEPPSYINPDSFREQAVTIGSGKWALSGTLTLPVGDKTFPAIVLVHGSGPQDRDQSIGPNKPFRDLAWGLASKGIAVLRYEKRTKAHPAEFAALGENFTVKEETIDDALAAVNLLKQTDRIDPKKIFVLGHSLGGMLIPRIGKLNSNIAGLIVMAAPTRPFEDVIVEQYSYIFGIDGIISESERAELQAIKRQVARVKDPRLSDTVASSELPFGIPARYWLDLRGYEPHEAAKELQQPMLILQGGRDYQVTRADFQGWETALFARKNVEFKMYAELNHLFIPGEGKSTPDEYQLPGYVAEVVVNDMADWVKRSLTVVPTFRPRTPPSPQPGL